MKKMKLFLIIIAALAAVVVGCSDRGTNTPTQMVLEESRIFIDHCRKVFLHRTQGFLFPHTLKT